MNRFAECPPAMDGMERFACPTPDRQGRYRCIDDHVLCDGFIDCPDGEDEERQACMFYKTVSNCCCWWLSVKQFSFFLFFKIITFIRINTYVCYRWIDFGRLSLLHTVHLIHPFQISPTYYKIVSKWRKTDCKIGILLVYGCWCFTTHNWIET